MSASSEKILMVIPSINGGHFLERMLPTLRVPPANIVVLDQGSTDTTTEICARFGVEIVQLGGPRTYTQASNIGFAIARERGLPYLCISNNDITFRTDVLSELLAEMEADASLGIVAPSQIIVDEKQGVNTLSYRVYWSLDKVDFFHDKNAPKPAVERIESDFCELTCALVRMSALEEIGGLDDEYGFYHEDADLGLSLRRAGYGCAYLPRSQIEHYSGSTINGDKLARRTFIAKNKLYFAQKNLGFGVAPAQGNGFVHGRNSQERDIRQFLRLFGLTREDAPELHFSSTNAPGEGFLYTTFDAPRIPARWVREKDRHQAIFTPFAPMKRTFSEAGFENVFHVPLGIETDLFHPWVESRRLFDETTFLAFVDGADTPSLTLLRKAWAHFRTATSAPARLVLFGDRLVTRLGQSPDKQYRNEDFEIAEFVSQAVVAYETLRPLPPSQLASFYRSVDFTIVVSPSANPLAILESTAVGTPVIRATSPGDASDPPGALSFHLNGEDGGVVDLARRLEEALHLAAADKTELAAEGVRAIRNRFTLRNTVLGFEAALASLQVRDPTAIIEGLKRRSPVAQAIAVDGGADTRLDAWRKRASSMAARRVRTLGRLTMELGSAWEEKGFALARRSAAAELGRFLSYRSNRLRGSGRHLSSVVKRTIGAFGRDKSPIAGSILLIGYIDAQLGLGQSSRGLATAMAKSRLDFAIHPLIEGVENRRGAPFLPERYDDAKAHEVNIIEVATNELSTVFRTVDTHRLSGSYNILRTYWELGRAPDSWRSALSRIDEIWAPNDFVAESLRTIFEGPITVIPPCVELPEWQPDPRERFGMEEGRHYFLFSFDYYSFPQRKNPLAVVHAFCEAFPDPSTNVGLIVKSTGAEDHFPEIKEALRIASDQDERIVILDESLTRLEMISLIHVADCYVSLHRSEGFGLGMAEAMAMAKPVIGTDYSGNTEFLTHETGYPVPYRLRRVAPDEYIHTEGQVWAEPSEQACAQDMRRVFANRDEAREKGLAARRFIEQRFGSDNVGRLVRERLDEIFAARRAQGPR